MLLCTEILDQIVAQAVAEYPNEACGILVGEKGQDSASEYIACRNLYDEMHARDPETYPRTARTAYLIDPREQQRLFDEAAGAGQEVKAIVHSHTDHDAYFSAEDKLVAAPWGEPMYPGVTYLVVSIRDRKLKEMNLYEWQETKKDFIGRRIES